MSAELFLELGTEEIPAGFIPRALDDIKRLLGQELAAARISYGEIRTFATPRRLAISIADVAREQQRQELKLSGPPLRIAFDADGKPTKAAEGFARTNGVSVADLSTIKTEKGEYLFLSKVVEGGKAVDQLMEILPRMIGKIPFKKSAGKIWISVLSDLSIGLLPPTAVKLSHSPSAICKVGTFRVAIALWLPENSLFVVLQTILLKLSSTMSFHRLKSVGN